MTPDRVQTHLIGRDEPLKMLQKAIEGTESSKGSSYLVSGEARIGKTVLVQEVMSLARSRDWTLMSGECMATGSDPYLPVVKAIKEFLEDFGDMDGPEEKAESELSFTPMGITGMGEETASPRFSVGPPVSLVADLTREREWMFDRISTFLEETAKHSPVLFFLDDLQWADKASLQLLFYLVRTLRDHRILFIGAYRPEDIELSPERQTFLALRSKMDQDRLVTTIKLKRFSEEETADHIRSLVGPAIPATLAQGIHEKTGGNPYFIAEFVKVLLEKGVIRKDGGQVKTVDLASLGVPHTIADHVKLRLGDLRDDERKILEQGAVAGQSFNYDVLSSTLETDEGDMVDALEHLMEKHIIEEREEDGEVTYWFTNKLIRDVVYNGLSRARRRMMHTAIGNAIESVHGPEREVFVLAYHFRMAGNMSKALSYSMRAGERAMASYAFDEAMDHFKRALEMLELMEVSEDTTDREMSLLLKMGHISTIRGETRVALQYYNDVISLSSEDGKERAEALLEVGLIQTKRTEWAEAMAAFNKALEIGEALGDHRLIASALRGIGRIHWRKGDHEGTLKYTEQAIEEAKKIGDRRIVVEGHMDIAGSFAKIKGDHEKALQYLRQAMDIMDPDKDPDLMAKATINMGDLWMKYGEYEKALDCSVRAFEVAERSGNILFKAFGTFNIGECRMKMGMFEEALPYIDRSMRIFERIEDTNMVGLCHQLKGVIHRELGDHEGSEAQFRSAMRLQEDQKLVWGLGTTLLEFGRLEKACDHRDQARDLLHKAFDIFETLGDKGALAEVEKELKDLGS